LGDWWAWFGGILGFTEVGSVDQDISIPGRSCADLSFYLEIPAANTTGYMNVAVDGRTFFTATEADIASYPVPYTQVTVDVSAFADNGIHNLLFETTTDASFGVLNFFVDDVAVTTTPKTFNDVPPGFWAENYISAIACNNITTGCGGSNYCPGGIVTRGQMAAFIIRALYGEIFTFSPIPHFSDVPDTHMFFKYIQRMFEDGITTGCGGGNYCPGSSVTRAQMAAFIMRALYGENFSFLTTAHFSDVPDTHLFFKYIQRMFEEGITTGCTATTYCPSLVVTRAQMAVFLTRAFLK
jgi:hypothetical protein